jgi:2-iminobutanoate/2-iminopropanoate deaminase
MSELPIIINTQKAPQAVGPYSQGISAGGLLFTAGQIPLDPDNGQMVPSRIEDQTHRVLKNLAAVLEAAGTSLDRVMKVTVFMTDLSQFKLMNEVYGEYFVSNPPARSTVEVAALPLGAQIEIECVAVVGE